MARTIYGNLTGAAAATERREQKASLFSGPGMTQLEVLIRLLTTLEGETFTDWLKAQPVTTSHERTQQLQARLETVKIRLGNNAIAAKLLGRKQES